MSSVPVNQLFLDQWEQETIDICRIRTYRSVDLSNEQVNENIRQIREYFKEKAAGFNAGLTTLQLVPFQWCKVGDTTTHDPTDAECLASSYWVFGFRFGAAKPTRKVAIICHVDTVPASDDNPELWTPFDPKPESLDYEAGTESPQDFLIGRGCVDDKGPAISAFIAARALAKTFDGKSEMDDLQIEIIFDTSEETDMSTPHYLEDEGTVPPDFGIVYDAMWCVRAEKGCERPVFTVVNPATAPAESLYIRSLDTTAANSTNTIPDEARAEITGDPSLLAEFERSVHKKYDDAEFDDKNYRKAELKTSTGEDSVILRTSVMGAQHGSAPEENRRDGANPLVSLANFLAGLASEGTIAVNAGATICKFIRWTWGTRVFGEGHESLYKFDEVFKEGNGTTYGVTKVTTLTKRTAEEGSVKQDAVRLEVDIRYAIDHHESGWDGVQEGLLDGDESVFKEVFGDLVRKFNSMHPRHPNVSFGTQTMFGPDIRIPDLNNFFQMVEDAYAEVMGARPQRLAIGGGTDAKGYTFLLAVGPLFLAELGPPINYHGIKEGAPKKDIEKSTEILFHILKKATETPPQTPPKDWVMKSLKRVAKLRAKGHKFCCE